MKKILIVSTVSRQFYLFEQGNIEVLRSLGYEVHAAANFNDANKRLDTLDIHRHHFDIERSPFSLKNIKAYNQLKKIMNSEQFDAVHCHSPMGGVLARLVAKAVGISTIIYTAHGFHFYKGAHYINWMLYYPIEKFLSKYTDVLITINQEDFNVAKGFKTNKVFHVPGIGVDINKFKNLGIDRDNKRKELGISEDTVVLLSIGELIKRKNHEIALKALAKMNIQNYVYLICGRGELLDYLQDRAKTLGIEDKVKFLGFRDDINEICLASDIFIFPSFQEGLPVSVIEAMSAGLPVICSSIRGNIDLIQNDKGGFLVEPEDIKGLTNSIEQLVNSPSLQKKMRLRNLREVEKYSKESVKNGMKSIYSSIFFE